MDYDIIIATRNRLDALRMSLPLIGRQTRPPVNLIVVDSSDDSTLVAQVLNEHPLPHGIEVTLVRSDQANLCHQRNLGVERVVSPITMLPDDDSLWFPDTAETVMNVYEADAAEAIGGVSSTQTGVSPVEGVDLAYKVDYKLLLKKRFDPARNAVEDIFFEAPYRSFSRTCPAFLAPPSWTQKAELPSLGLMTGFRMSFRSNILRSNAFDPILGHKIGWCLWEDADMSLRVLASGKSLVAVPRSRVFHHSFPSKRANGFDYGFSHIANYAYVCCKVMPRTAALRRQLDRYLGFKMMLYKTKRDDYGRDVYRGALAAWSRRHMLWDAPTHALGDAFMAICDASPGTRLDA